MQQTTHSKWNHDVYTRHRKTLKSPSSYTYADVDAQKLLTKSYLANMAVFRFHRTLSHECEELTLILVD